jgi:hypothetical protein
MNRAFGDARVNDAMKSGKQLSKHNLHVNAVHAVWKTLNVSSLLRLPLLACANFPLLRQTFVGLGFLWHSSILDPAHASLSFSTFIAIIVIIIPALSSRFLCLEVANRSLNIDQPPFSLPANAQTCTRCMNDALRGGRKSHGWPESADA